ncbi:MAG: DUF5819 family protein [Mucilaginibacter sp.]
MKRFFLGGFVLLLLHFTVIATYILSETFHVDRVHELSSRYANPVFEQHWAMFSNPGHADIFTLLRFSAQHNNRDTIISPWLDITSPVIKRGALLFSGDQRLSKYVDGSVNNIFEALDEGQRHFATIKDTAKRAELVKKHCMRSTGYENLTCYARHVYSQLSGTSNFKNVNVSIRIIISEFPSFEQRQQRLKRTYSEIIFPNTKIL